MMHSSLVLAQEGAKDVDVKTETTKVASSAVIQSPADQILKMVVGLIVVLIFIFIIAWLAKNYMGFSPSSNSALKPIAGVSVGQKERVVLLQVSDRQVLVGVSPGSVNMLYVLDKESEVDVTVGAHTNVFAEKLKASMNKLEKS
ncbi:flagellar biosynthetic protein FliO [Pseudomonadota bacterium]